VGRTQALPGMHFNLIGHYRKSFCQVDPDQDS
jgi:hypothetical protein